MAPAAVLPDTIEPPESLIKISRSKAAPPEAALLRQAYAAYRNGDQAAAAEAYAGVLERRPENRDALLGLAALALRQDQPQRALNLYARLLRLNPQDHLARAALISMSRNTDPSRGETAIKLMLREQPEQAYLHFALGNVYAGQSRWSDAQQAFFDAYRLDSGNADYAMNLAVSLDHLGKPETALDYYRTALDLAGEGGANFDAAALENRVRTLEGARQP
jgi:tetratricopeptide (TPR) repeat protein